MVNIKYAKSNCKKEFVTKPKELQKTPKAGGPAFKSGGYVASAVAENQIIKHKTKSILKNFKNFYSSVA